MNNNSNMNWGNYNSPYSYGYNFNGNNYNGYNYQQNSNNSQQRTTNIDWVNGIEGAKAKPIKPNEVLWFLDSENEGMFYIKSADNIGMSSIRTFKYQEVSLQDDNKNDLSQYVKKDELAELMTNILNGMGGLRNDQTVSTINGTTNTTNKSTYESSNKSVVGVNENSNQSSTISAKYNV